MLDELWAQVLASIAQQNTSDYVGNIIRRIEPKEIIGNQVVLEVSSRFEKDYIESNIIDILFGHVKKVFNFNVELKFVVNPSKLKTRKSEDKVSLPQAKPHAAKHQAAPIFGFLKPKFTFDSFVVGRSNEFAYNVCLTCAEQPGKKYNPLFISGGPGLGKTHLLNAIGHFLLDHDPNLRIILLSAERFMNEFVNMMRNKSDVEFKQKYREHCDVLLIDDIQFLAGKTGTMEEFFHTFNALSERGRQIVLTSDKPPSELNNFEARLKSRFMSGLPVDIDPPELETRIAILLKKASAEGVSFPVEVATYVATHLLSNVRDLEGVLTRIIAFSGFKGVEISIELARECMKSYLKGPTDALTPETLLKTVAEASKIKVEDLRSSVRKQTIAVPRQIAMYLLRKRLCLSFSQIGAHFDRDHTTVMHACEKIEELLKTDHDMKLIVRTIENKLAP